MSDVFVSYKAEDRRRVVPLVEGLQAHGLSVWWDAQIGGGDSWRERIEAQLDSARCVIVIWSKRSVGPDGHFVRDEASRAQRKHIYLPVLIDRVEPPLGFGETQALSLAGWKGNPSDARFRVVLDCARAIVAGTSDAVRAAIPAPSPVSRRSVLIGGTAAAAAAVGVGGWVLLRPRSPGGADSIAVMPFANLSGDPSQAYFSDGIAEELRAVLARIPRLKVIGRTSSELVRNADAVTAAHKLGVANVVTGSVRRSPSLIRVSAQLVSGEDGVEQWSQVYDRAPGDILQIQSDIAASVAGALRLELNRVATDALTAGGTNSAAAYDLYLKAVATREGGLTEESLRQAISLFDAAIARDPKFADAFAQKAQTLADLTGVFSSSPAEFDRGYDAAASNARRAIALAPQRALGHTALAVTLGGKLDIQGALAEYRKASNRFTGEVEVLTSYSYFAARMGLDREALTAADKAVLIDPLNPRPRIMRSFAHFYARRYEDAEKAVREALDLPNAATAFPYALLGNCQVMSGKIAEARASFAHAPADNLYRLAGEAVLDVRSGDRAGAERRLARIRELFGDSAAYQQAQVLAQLKQTDRALAALQRAREVRDPGLTSLPVHPFLDPIRSDPRFGALERRLGFPRT
jgi:serine/threonine-protein kinase